MRLPLFGPFLGLLLVHLTHMSNAHSHESNLTYFGAPRFSIEGVLPVFDIAESYIRSQADGSVKQIGTKGEGGCSASNSCILGSCCNSDGQCGYSARHCSPSHPKTCVANCDAKAPCGEFSKDGKTVCPLNACCSRLGFCGTSDVFCRDMSVKAGAGAINAPSCGKGSGTASRRVAYYQSWNSRRRACDKVLPNQLDLTGITHLVLSFATIDPATFQVGLMNPDDDDIYKQFMALPDNVAKWIGVGGYEFTDSGPTQHTWSEMTASQQNRKTFIDSLKDFCSKWGFKGVDIDWEWPGHENRGGRSGDGANQVQLVKEMRETLGSGFGIGVVIPAQYDYMKNLDPKGLESHVDMMTMLTYDLHGAWDMTIPGLGPTIKPHTDLKEIDESFKLLWSSNIDSKKVNMGIANYGRGYTVPDKSCMHYGCTYSGPSKAGSCTRQDGVLSLCEIHRLMDEKHLTSNVIAGGAEVNEVTWDDQWIAFDDAGTFGKKLELANDRCLGGTALWAIDYATCPGGGGSPPGPGSSAPPAQSPIAPPSSVASTDSPSRPPSNSPAPSPTSEKISSLPPPSPATSGPGSRSSDLSAPSSEPWLTSSPPLPPASGSSVVSSSRPLESPSRPPVQSFSTSSIIESSWVSQSSTTTSDSWSVAPSSESWSTPSSASVPAPASSDKPSGSPSQPLAPSSVASSVVESTWAPPATEPSSKSDAPSSVPWSSQVLPSKPWSALPTSEPWSDQPPSAAPSSAPSSSAPGSAEPSSVAPPSSSASETIVPVPIRSSGASSGWTSSEVASSTADSWSSARPPPTASSDPWVTSSISVSSAAWSSKTSAPPAWSSQPSVPPASGTDSSGTWLSAIPSATWPSAAPSSTDLPTGSATGSWKPTTAPSSTNSVVASVIPSQSFAAPAPISCPGLCWNYGWCKEFCTKARPEQPPAECQDFDWCRRWWTPSPTTSAVALPHPPLPTYVWCPGPCGQHEWCRQWCSNVMVCPMPKECMVFDWCWIWWDPCREITAPPSTTTPGPPGQPPPAIATTTKPPLPDYVWCPGRCWGHEWCKPWCSKVISCPMPIECLGFDWCWLWWAACGDTKPGIDPPSFTPAPSPTNVGCPDACRGLPWCSPLCDHVISCPAPFECLVFDWCRDWFMFCLSDPVMPKPGVIVTKSIDSGTSQGTNGPGATPTGTNGPDASQPATNAPSTTAASDTAAPAPSGTGALIWCPNDCKNLEWCNYWCKNAIKDSPPKECWDFDWCILWWGWPRIKGTNGKDKDKPEPECKLLGCGCGWMGLPWGPGCPGGKFPFPLDIIIEIIGLFPDRCLFFGCNGLCGLLGCDGWCFGKGGCPVHCPWPLCHYDGWPKIGPPPFPLPFGLPKPPKPGKPDPNHPDPNNPGPTNPPDDPVPCQEKDYKTATERLVYCGEFVYESSGISATTVSSSASTTASTTTSTTSTCHTVYDFTVVGCNVLDDLSTTTTSITKSNSLNISSETPGPACTRAPLSLDDDEGNNIPVDWDSITSSFGANMTDFSSLISKSSATPTSSSASSSAIPSADCSACWKYFDETCVKKLCSPEDPTWCAYHCLTDMCQAPNSPKQCIVGQECAHKACPTDVMGPPKEDLTLTLTFSSATATVTMPSTSTYPTSSSVSATPSADCGACWKYFDETCVKKHCDPANPTWCAFTCFSDMCLAPGSPKQCIIGQECAHKACPSKPMEPPKEEL